MFLLSPANAGGPRGRLLQTSPNVPLAARLRAGERVPIGELYAFISALYFRGKLAYADRFAAGRSFVITPCLGLLEPATPVGADEYEALARVPIDTGEPRYLEPLRRDVVRLARDEAGEVVLLGSIASPKYTQPLIDVLGSRLVFPATFVGRGDMSRGGVLLRAARAGEELEYIPVAGAVLRGTRPPKLPRA
ncbi:hypothetical protein TBR22_A12660 [Luteitalea sp. TBR-22]|nr:hypothetical protein TBR22_A12660 [Luteitalea sp. TBR-22]